jgi:signal transduction histidine kinase/ActR/RegA family two-component response regulator
VMGMKAMQHGAQDYLVKNQVQSLLLGKAIRYAIERANLIAARKHTEAVLRRSEKLQALGTLAAGIAHDFNNILLTVSGNAKLALSDLPPDHAAYISVAEIAKASSRAISLVKKIAAFSRPQTVNRQAMQLVPVVEEAISMLRATLPAQIKIHCEFSSDLPHILADPSQVHQIIVNLAVNAADAMGDRPGVLDVRACAVRLNGQTETLSSSLASGDYVRLTVRDNGAGMDKKTVGRVLEPFFTTKPQGRGTGMGLAIVYGIMKEHLGEVTIASELGKGTIVDLYFPVSQGALVEAPAPPPPISGQREHILYVDDEEPLVFLVSRLLTRMGYQVTGLTDPREALRLLGQRPSDFQVLVTDLSMPRMSGIDLAYEAMKICPQISVIVTTGYIRPQDEEEARRIGVGDLILKPDAVEELGSALHRLLEGARAKSHLRLKSLEQ